MTFAGRAKAFAAHWYARPEYACNETTLAYMVALEIERAAIEVEQQTRDEIAGRLAQLTRKNTT